MNMLKMLSVAVLVMAVSVTVFAAAATAPSPAATGTARAPAAAKAPAAPASASWHATLVKADGKNLVVKVAATKGAAAKQLTVATDDRTKFMLDYAPATLADLKPDMTLTIDPAEGTAALVRAHVKGLTGVVVKVDGKNVVITAAATKKEIAVATDDKTAVFIGGKPAKLADLKAGTKVKVIPETGAAAKIAQVLTKAEATGAPAPALTGWHATLVKVDGRNLAVKVAATKTAAAKQVTVATDDKTKFVLDYAPAALADLKPDMTLTINPDEGTATLIRAHVKGLYGTVVKVDGKNVVITATKTKKEVAVASDDKTAVFIEGKPAKPADLKAGMEVKVIPETGTAAKIAVVPAEPATTEARDTPKVVAPAKEEN